MTPIDIQVSRSKVKVKDHAYSLYVGEGGISYKHLYLYFNYLVSATAGGPRSPWGHM